MKVHKSKKKKRKGEQKKKWAKKREDLLNKGSSAIKLIYFGEV